MDGESYYEGVVVETRSGTNTQEVISNFNDTFYTKSLDYQLTDTARTDTVPGNATQGIVTKIEFPRGLYYANDSGGLSEAWVKLRGDYRLGEDGEWIPFIYEKATTSGYVKRVEDQSAPYGNYTLHFYIDSEEVEDDTPTYYNVAEITYPDGTLVSRQYAPSKKDFTLGYFVLNIPSFSSTTTETFSVVQASLKITGSQSSAIRREFRLDGLTPGQYYVKMEVTARSNSLTDSRASVGCYWTGLTSIIYDDFSYPNIALIGIKALATDQINGSPTLKFKKTRSKIYAWNPHANEYQEKNANNPAWACYDAVHLCRHMEHPGTHEWEYHVFGVKAERMLYDQFEEWAAFCEEKQLYVNIEINQLGEMLDVINQKMAPIGHGKVLRFGTRYGCTWDCIKQPVQMFGMGNIKAGTFQEQFLPTNDRANAVEITYMDADNDFNRETITIMADDYDTAAEEKTAQATFDGITSYEQAYREGKYQLYCNKYRLRTVSFEADIDAISCTIGDVVLVAHDVPKWAKSGRIHEVKGDELLLPVELSDPTKSYRLLYRTINDNMYTTACEILENKDGWCRVKIASFNAEDPPQRHDIFDLAEANIGSKPFVIQNISRAKSFSRKIECVEYDERVYSEDYDIPEIEYQEYDLKPKNVTNLSATLYHYVTADGVTRQHIDASWSIASAGSFTVSVLSDGAWNVLVTGLNQNRYSVDFDGEAEQLKVVTVYGVMVTSGTVADILEIDTMVLALTIYNLHATFSLSDNILKLTAGWDAIDHKVLKTYTADFDGDEKKITDESVQYNGITIGSHVLKVKAQSINGTYGNNAVINYSEETDSTPAYVKTVPLNSISYAELVSVGGRTICWNNYGDIPSTSSSAGISMTNTDGVLRFTGKAISHAYFYLSASITMIAGHKYYCGRISSYSSTGTLSRVQVNMTPAGGGSTYSLGSVNTAGSFIANPTQDGSATAFFVAIQGETVDITLSPFFVDLTFMFGSGNEPTISQFEQIFPAVFYAKNNGVLLSAPVTNVISKNEGGSVIANTEIPSAVRSLTGYGWGISNTIYNYIDFARKKFVQKVGRVVLDGNTVVITGGGAMGSNYRFAAANVSMATPKSYDGNLKAIAAPVIYSYVDVIANYATSNHMAVGIWQNNTIFILFIGSSVTTVSQANTWLQNNPVTIYYELATPIETDISAYIGGTYIGVDGNGSLTFPNDNEDNFRIPVPSSEDYMKKV